MIPRQGNESATVFDIEQLQDENKKLWLKINEMEKRIKFAERIISEIDDPLCRVY